MGRKKVEQPKRIAQKLRQIRLDLGFTQDAMTKAIEREGVRIHPSYVALFEIADRVPSILTILAYARIAKIPMEAICDDKMDLPTT
jgi:transcriptional regulator with XRE-family HTH domain